MHVSTLASEGNNTVPTLGELALNTFSLIVTKSMTFGKKLLACELRFPNGRRAGGDEGLGSRPDKHVVHFKKSRHSNCQSTTRGSRRDHRPATF